MTNDNDLVLVPVKYGDFKNLPSIGTNKAAQYATEYPDFIIPESMKGRWGIDLTVYVADLPPVLDEDIDL